ncbi:hypothetical protein HOH45_07025 [bacterium]|jgi:hypothetical protein|nr:hypothetical protein [bacterium]
MGKSRINTELKIGELLDISRRCKETDSIILSDFSSDDWTVIAKEVTDNIRYIELCTRQILKLDAITFSTTSSILSKIIFKFEEILRVVGLLKLDLVYEQVHQFVDHFEKCLAELENDSDNQNFFNFLNHFIATESKFFISNFNDIVDCMLSSTFVGRGRFGKNEIYDVRRVNGFRLNAEMTSIYYASTKYPEKIIVKYTKFKEQTIEHSGQKEILSYFKTDAGDIIAYFHDLGTYSNIYRFGESVSKTFTFLYNFEGGDNVPYAICYENKLFITHLESDIRELSSFLEEKKGFYWVPGEEKPFFMATMDVKRSRFYENIDLSLSKNRQDPDFGYRKTFSIKKIGYPYRFESFGFEKIKFSVKSEGVCLIKIGFHSFPVIDSNVDVGTEPFPLMEIASSSSKDYKSSYVSLPINLGAHNVRFLKSGRGNFYILSKDFVYENKGNYFRKKKDNSIVTVRRVGATYCLEINCPKKDWTAIAHDQSSYTFSRSLFSKLMDTFEFRIVPLNDLGRESLIDSSNLTASDWTIFCMKETIHSMQLGLSSSDDLCVKFKDKWIKLTEVIQGLTQYKDEGLADTLALYKRIASCLDTVTQNGSK